MRKYAEYQNNYFKEKTKCICLRLFVGSDQDIIDHLDKIKAEGKGNFKSGICEYIRALIRKDMNK